MNKIGDLVVNESRRETVGEPPVGGGRASVAARLDRLPANRYIWTLIILVSCGAFFENFDWSLSAPLNLGLTAAGIFHKGSTGLFGMSDLATFIAVTFSGIYVGTLGFAVIADRYGRRLIFTVALLWYSGATVVMAFQASAIAIDLWRFIASIGIGVELVTIDCYLVELAPKAIRGKAFAISTAVQNLASPIVAFCAWLLIPGEHFGVDGWRCLSLLPAVGAVVIWWLRRSLPESPRWLESNGRFEEADRIVTMIESRSIKASRSGLPPVETPGRPTVLPRPLSLWKPPYRRRVMALIVFHVFQVIGYFGVSNWLPTLLVSQGITIEKSLGYFAVMQIVSPIAPLVFGLFADRFERKWLVITALMMIAVFGLLMGQLTANTSSILVVLIGFGVTIGTMLMSLSYHIYQAEMFPTRLRVRAIGLVYSFSRLSGIFTGYVVAATLDHSGSSGVFALIAGSMIIASLAIGLFGPRTRGLALDDI